MINMGEINLSDFISTKSQALFFSACLHAIADKVYETDFDLEKNLREQIGTIKTEKFLMLMRDNDVPLASNSALIEFFRRIQETISSLPSAGITMAIEPTEQMLKSISNWLLLNLKKQVLIEPEVDHSIIAGAAVSFQGKRLDSSIGSEFDRIYTETIEGIHLTKP